MRAISARRRATVVASATALFLGTVLVSGVGPANAATTPKTGGILTLLEHEPRLDHLDPRFLQRKSAQ